MAELLSPGVFPVEVPFDAFVRPQGTSTFGIVGVFEKGPVATPVFVTSLADARAKFGTYLDASGHFAMHALTHFFEHGGSRAWVVRVAKYTAGVSTATAATAILQDRAPVPLSTLRVDASSPGVWAPGITVEVQASAALPATGFNLVVKSAAGTVLETFKDLLIGSANAASDDYAPKRVNKASAFIALTDLLSVTAAPNNRPALVTTTLAGGNDGLAGIAVSDYLGTSTQANGLFAFDTVFPNFIAIPGVTDATLGPALNAGLLSYASGRHNLFAITEAPQGSTAQTMVDFRNGTGSFSHPAFDDSFGAQYGPWQKTTHPLTGATIEVPVGGMVAGVYAQNDQIGAVHTAPAGPNRGLVRGSLGTDVPISKGDRDLMYSNNVNPVSVVNGRVQVFGQRTLQIKNSTTSSVNVRRMLIQIEQSISTATENLVFEPNIKRTWEAFKRLANPFLQSVKDAGGLDDFLVVVDESTTTPALIAQGVMKARVFVKPVLAAEFILLEFALALPGTNVQSLA